MHRAAEYLPADMKEEDLKPPAVPFYSPVEEGDDDDAVLQLSQLSHLSSRRFRIRCHFQLRCRAGSKSTSFSSQLLIAYRSDKRTDCACNWTETNTLSSAHRCCFLWRSCRRRSWFIRTTPISLLQFRLFSIRNKYRRWFAGIDWVMRWTSGDASQCQFGSSETGDAIQAALGTHRCRKTGLNDALNADSRSVAARS